MNTTNDLINQVVEFSQSYFSQPATQRTSTHKTSANAEANLGSDSMSALHSYQERLDSLYDWQSKGIPELASPLAG